MNENQLKKELIEKKVMSVYQGTSRMEDVFDEVVNLTFPNLRNRALENIILRELSTTIEYHGLSYKSGQLKDDTFSIDIRFENLKVFDTKRHYIIKKVEDLSVKYDINIEVNFEVPFYKKILK